VRNGQVDKDRAFFNADRKHVWMLTNHGMHAWNVIPGLPDTGGQNIFVNLFSDAFVQQGYKVTIVNRGGYTHAAGEEPRTGFHYRNSYERILYLEDGLADFVRKEDMGDRLPQILTSLQNCIESEKEQVDLIVSHYWDGGILGQQLQTWLQTQVRHVWVPHSLGCIKKRNTVAARWEGLRVDERIAFERQLLASVDAVAATSSLISQSLLKDYAYRGQIVELPPCVDPARFHPRKLDANDELWTFLAQHSHLSEAEIRTRKLIVEVSRTDTTKRKDILLRAIDRVRRDHPEVLLVLTIDQTHLPLGPELMALVAELNLQEHVIVVGLIFDILPELYAATKIYCTPSIMEGFGMSAEEAAATAVPVVASDKVPFVREALLGEDPKPVSYANTPERAFLQGEGALVVPSDDVDGFAAALSSLLADDALRQQMGKRAYEITIPSFTWPHRMAEFLQAIK